jgi:hypothetical protein
LVEWIEDFKSRFSDYPEEARPTIDEVESALNLYKQTIEPAMLKVNIQKARAAKRAEGSVLEYGLTWHLERFVGDVRSRTSIIVSYSVCSYKRVSQQKSRLQLNLQRNKLKSTA